jgi:transcriptional regulator with XRE-family HTH domain
MPKTSKALIQLPTSTRAGIQKLGADLAVARLRRKESLQNWSKRLGVSISTLQRLEAGDPSISIGIVATALWLIRQDGALAQIASPANDTAAIEMDVREAVELGRARARASMQAHISAKSKKRLD